MIESTDISFVSGILVGIVFAAIMYFLWTISETENKKKEKRMLDILTRELQKRDMGKRNFR